MRGGEVEGRGEEMRGEETWCVEGKEPSSIKN
jgi:hypothetical protein